jgi:N-acetylmuramoyl-L-alanine amidase
MRRSDIVIDAGHGDDAAVGHSTPIGVRGPGGTLEKDVTLRLAEHLADALGPLAELTRASDTNLSLAARAALAREAGARVFISLHTNSGRAGERGAEAWIHDRANEDSRRLAGRVLAALAALPGAPPTRGVKTGTMAVLTPEELAPETAACLLEVDFLSDPDAERRLGDDNTLGGIAVAIARALRDHLGEQPSTSPMPMSMSPAGAMSLGSRRTGTGTGAHPNAPASRALPPRHRYGASGAKRALLVGINDYTLARPDGKNNLGGCVADADAMARLLQRPALGFSPADVQRLGDRGATKAAVITALRDLMTVSQAGDVLCFYYSGHGTYVPDDASGVAGRFAQALYCADGQPLLDRELAELVTNSLADGVNFTVILDSCFAGGMGEIAGVPDNLRGQPLPAEMEGEGTAVTLLPVGLCVPLGTDSSVPASILNSRLVCERRPNTTAVPYARAMLFSAVDFVEVAGERNGRGDYTTALEHVLGAATGPQSCEEVQRGVVEEIEQMRADGLADDYEHPMLRGQGSRMRAAFLQPFDQSEVGLSVATDATKTPAPPTAKKKHHHHQPPSKAPPPATAKAPAPASDARVGGQGFVNGYGHPHGRHELYDVD